jgi:signal peptidase II
MIKDKHNYYFISVFILVLIDQITKVAVKGFDIFGITHQGMFLGDSFSVIGDFLRITFVENEGMALGIKFGAGKIFLSLFSIIATIALFIYLKKLKPYDFWVKLSIMLILSGAFGNLIDRVFYGVFYGESPLFYGKVVDFIQVDIPDITIPEINIFNSTFLPELTYTHWPVFNVADSCVSCGVVLLLIFHKRIPTMKEVFKKNNIEIYDSNIDTSQNNIQTASNSANDE